MTQAHPDTDTPDVSVLLTAMREQVQSGESLMLVAGGRELPLTGVLAQQIVELIEARASGVDVRLVAERDELTTGQVADILGVSRPTVVALVDSGELPARRLGTHRRVRSADLKAYVDARSKRRSQGMDEVVRLSRELNLYDD